MPLGRHRSDGFEHWHDAIESAKHAKRLFDEELQSGRDPYGIGRPRVAEAREVCASTAIGPAPPSPGARCPSSRTRSSSAPIDRDGGAVALIQSLGGVFGSGVVSSRTGILLGNRGAALALDPEAGPLLGPGQQPPLVSVPAFAASRDGRIVSLGATGPRAGVSVLQTASRLLLGAGLEDALEAPRFAFGAAQDGPGTAVLVEEAFDSSLRSRLRSAAHDVVTDETAASRTSGAVMRLPLRPDRGCGRRRPKQRRPLIVRTLAGAR